MNKRLKNTLLVIMLFVIGPMVTGIIVSASDKYGPIISITIIILCALGWCWLYKGNLFNRRDRMEKERLEEELKFIDEQENRNSTEQKYG